MKKQILLTGLLLAAAGFFAGKGEAFGPKDILKKVPGGSSGSGEAAPMPGGAGGGGALDFKRKMGAFKNEHHEKSSWNQIGNSFKNEFQTCYQQVKKQTDAGVSYTMYYVKCGRMFSDDGGTCVAQYIQCDTKKNVCRVDDPSYLSSGDACPPQPAETTRVKG